MKMYHNQCWIFCAFFVILSCYCAKIPPKLEETVIKSPYPSECGDNKNLVYLDPCLKNEHRLCLTLVNLTKQLCEDKFDFTSLHKFDFKCPISKISRQLVEIPGNVDKSLQNNATCVKICAEVNNTVCASISLLNAAFFSRDYADVNSATTVITKKVEQPPNKKPGQTKQAVSVSDLVEHALKDKPTKPHEKVDRPINVEHNPPIPPMIKEDIKYPAPKVDPPAEAAGPPAVLVTDPPLKNIPLIDNSEKPEPPKEVVKDVSPIEEVVAIENPVLGSVPDEGAEDTAGKDQDDDDETNPNDYQDLNTGLANDQKTVDPHPKLSQDLTDDHPLSPKQVTNGDFVDAEESHFFAYFLTFTCFVVMGYIAFHNKNKILALLLEGRRGRTPRRRPNSASYRKLDSLEEAMMAHPSQASTTHVIY